LEGFAVALFGVSSVVFVAINRQFNSEHIPDSYVGHHLQ